MHDHDKPGRAQDPVEEASGQSFPASDPPAWTAARAGKPEGQAGREARHTEDKSPPRHCEVIGLLRSDSEAKQAADALLASGFNLVDIGPPRRHGDLGAGIGAPVSANEASSIGLCAGLGALAAGAFAALFLPRSARHVMVAAAGGAVGAASAHAVARMRQARAAEPGWPPNAVLLRVRLKSPDDQKRALAILDAQGACKLQVSWRNEFDATSQK
jgi:hypothetical protein